MRWASTSGQRRTVVESVVVVVAAVVIETVAGETVASAGARLLAGGPAWRPAV